MSVLVYNGITFGPQGWLTLSFDQEPWYEDSLTDCMGTKITISGTFLLSPPIPPISAGLSAEDAELAGAENELSQEDDAATALVKIRNLSQFSKPRKNLSFKIGGTEMIPQLGTKAADSKNGPLPGPIRVRKQQNECFVCDLSIVSHWSEGFPNDQAGGVLTSRWRDSVVIDQDWLSRRTRTGKVIVSSSAFVTGQAIIDQLRDTLITCSIQPGFIRKSSDYILSENGLELSYTLVDEEQFRMVPTGTTFADGTMVVESQRMGSPGRMQIVSVTLRGPKVPASNPQELVKKATAIATLKGRLNGGFFPTKATFRENMWKNEVTVTLSGMAKPGKGEKVGAKFVGIEASLKGFGQTVAGQIGEKSPDPGTRGTADILLHAAAYQDPTLGKTLRRLDNSIIQGAKPNNPEGAAAKTPGG